MNTPKRGQFRHIVFKDGDTWYAVALEFNIVETGDDAKLAYFNLLQVAEGYIKTVGKVKGTKGGYQSLNQTGDPEYESMWKNLHASNPLKSPYQIDMYGVSSVHA
ncbi:MAG TPA: hypothetical protein PKA42_03270 [Candidatus Paceibacterota bacterium]|nr:hypothetical protein [Candidatus Paceibacterota bacterium]HMO83162.1 hypothetical protein [Candidatus Paceibacterota bacterium]